MTRVTPAVPDSLPIREALDRSAALSTLRRRLEDSASRYAAVQSTWPPTLSPHLRAGPVDADGWTLLAANASVAAKARQLEPLIAERLLACGFAPIKIRIKIRGQ